MKIKIIATAIITALGLIGITSMPVSANETYAGIQYALGTYNEDGIEEVNPTAVVGRLGKYINKNFAIEGRLGVGIQDDSINISGIDLALDIDSLIGVYGIGHINITESSSVYGLLGFTRAEATVTASAGGLSASVSDDDTGISYGVGADIGIGNNIALNIEYVQYLNKSDFDFSAFGLGFVFGF